MKKFTLIFFTFILFSFCTNKESKKEESYVPAKKEEIKKYYSNGKLRTEGEMRDGKRHGKWVYYYDNGFKWSEGMFKYGQRDGYALLFYKNGLKRVRGEYKDNVAVGDWEFYDEDGDLKASVNAEENPKEIEKLLSEGAEKFSQ